MSLLWNPTKEDVAALNRGNKKIALHWLKKEKDAKETNCTFCGKTVLTLNDQTLLTLNGSIHNCVKKKLHDKGVKNESITSM